MSPRCFFLRGFPSVLALFAAACGPGSSPEWTLLSEDSEGKPTYVSPETIHLNEDGTAVYVRAVGAPGAPDRVEFLQGLDCVRLRWVFLSLDESLLDSVAGEHLDSQEWPLLALTPANRALLDEVCSGIPPTRWIRVLLEAGAEDPGELKEVWVDRETLGEPVRDSVWTEREDLGFADEVVRSWTRWEDAFPDSGYLMTQADVACDLGVLRYLENSRYSEDGTLVRRLETTELWYPMAQESFERKVYREVCAMPSFFQPPPTPGTSPGGG